jgi:hypothetical protein
MLADLERRLEGALDPIDVVGDWIAHWVKRAETNPSIRALFVERGLLTLGPKA